MSVIGIRAKITCLNLEARLLGNYRRRQLHPSGYRSGASPDADDLTVFNEKRKIISHASRLNCHLHGLFHATVHLLLFNERGQLLVQRRSRRKDSSSGKLAQSVGGHIARGVGTQATLVKECREELLIDLSDFSFLADFPYESSNGANKEFVYLFRGQHNGPFQPNYSELDWAAFFNLTDIRALAQSRSQLFSPSFLQDLQHLRG
jgi:isopentenyldiphosphate isomerase